MAARRVLHKCAHVHRRGARVVGVFLLELIGEGAHDVVHLACKATRNRQKRRFPRSRRHPAGVSRRALHRSAARGTPAASADETTPWRPRSPTAISPPHTHPPLKTNSNSRNPGWAEVYVLVCEKKGAWTVHPQTTLRSRAKEAVARTAGPAPQHSPTPCCGAARRGAVRPGRRSVRSRTLEIAVQSVDLQVGSAARPRHARGLPPLAADGSGLVAAERHFRGVDSADKRRDVGCGLTAG